MEYPDDETKQISKQTAEIDPKANQALPGDFGDYRLIRKIGQGGMGIVYEAEQKSLGNRRLALKTIKSVGELDDRVLKRFKKEVEAVAQLEHRHIVPVFHVGEESGIPFYVMKFIEGNNLSQLVKTLRSAVNRKKASTNQRSDNRSTTPGNGTASENSTHQSGWSKGDTLASNSVLEKISREGSTANPDFVKSFARMGIQVAEALHHAHQQGVVHRDVKPANLILDVDGDVWLADFGLAMIRDHPDLTAPGTLVGTYHYMSPEQAMGSKRVIVDHRTDIYSLGVTLYELLTLRRAFPGDSREEILRSVQFDDPPPVRKIASRVPMDLETIVMKAMAKAPNARFQSAGEMASELQRFLDGKPLSIRPPTALERIGYWARANRQVVASLAALCLVTFIGAIVSSFLLMQEQAETQAALVSEQQQKAEVVKQKDQVTRLLQQSEGLRLAANSLLQVEDDPTLALQLGIEAAKRYPGADSGDAMMRALDAGHEARTLTGHAAPVGHVSFNQDGAKLVSSATTRRFMKDGPTESVEPAIVWDTQTAEVLGRLEDDRTITSAVFGPQNALVLTTSSPEERVATNDIDDTIPAAPPSLWDATTYRKLVTFDDAFLFKAHRHVFSPDGLKIVLPINGNQAAVFFCAGTKLVTLKGHSARVVFAAFNHQGDQVVTYSDDNTVRVWNATTGAEIHQFIDWQNSGVEKQPRDLTWVEFTPDGRRLAIGSKSRGIELRNLENNGEEINEHRISGASGVFYRHGDYFATRGGKDGETMTRLAIRNAYDTHWVADVVINKLINKVVISPDNRFAGVLYYDYMPSFQIWNLERSELVGTFGDGADPINDLVFSPDSKLIATASNDKNVRLWYVANGRSRATFPRATHIGRPVIAASPDGSTLSVATSKPDAIGALCNFGTPKQTLTLNAELAIPSLGGKRFLASGNGRLAIHSMVDGSFQGQEAFLHGDVIEMAINRNGDRAAAYTGGSNVLLWSPDNNHRLLLSVGNTHVNQLRFSPDGKRLFALSTDGKVRVWDANQGTLIQAIDNGGRLFGIDFSRDGNRFAIAAYGNIATLYDAKTLKEIRRFSGAGASFNRIRFTFDGKKLVTYGALQSKAVVLWDIVSGEQETKLNIEGSVGVAMHPSQPELLVWSSKKGALIWRYEENEQLRVTNVRTSGGAYSTDGQNFYLASSVPMSHEAPKIDDWPAKFAPPKVTRWSRETVQAQESIQFPLEAIHQVLVSDQDQVFVNAQRLNQVVNYDMDSREPITTIPGHFAVLSQCLYTSDSKRLITTSWDARVAIWTVSDGKLVHKWDHGSPILSAAISSDDKFLVTGARDGTCRIWDLDQSTDLEPVSELVSVSDSPIRHLAFAPDTNRVLALSSDNQAHLIKRESGKMAPLDFNAQSIEWVEFSPDGTSILVIPRIAPEDQRHWVLIVPLDESAVTKFEYAGVVLTSHFHPDSKRIVTTTKGGVVLIQGIQTREVERTFTSDSRFTQSAIFDPTGEFVFVSEFNAGTIWRVSDGRRWLTLEDANVVHDWRHRRNPFTHGQPRRVITRRFNSYQCRVSPLNPPEATKKLSLRPLTEAEKKRFRTREMDADLTNPE